MRSRVMVILPKAWSEVSEDEQILLSKILGSVKLSLASVHLLSLREFDVKDVEMFAPEQIITFGAICKGERALYEVLSVKGISILQADALTNLDDARKKSLWGALRQMFSR